MRYLAFVALQHSGVNYIFATTGSLINFYRGIGSGRAADPVHFRPDPDPANQNFKIGSGSRILLALKESFLISKFFSHPTCFF